MANKIRELRVQMQLSQSDFARYFEVPIKTLQKWETESSNPPDYVEKLMRRIHTLEEELAGVNILRNICNSTDTDTYILKGSKASSILLQGDGRKLIEIKDDSIACIVTDHPWYDPHNHLAEDQKNFADYNCFIYSREDFENKYRVLKDGSYIAEILPIRTPANKEYLNSIEEMAEAVGFKIYAYLTWHYSDTIYTGRTKKGKQQILIMSKGTARNLASKNGYAYKTTEMLEDIHIPLKTKEKKHQAEKPVELYEYLIKNLSKEGEVILDQFGGSCNMMLAATNLNRSSVVYEIDEKFVKKAVDRLKLKQFL